MASHAEDQSNPGDRKRSRTLTEKGQSWFEEMVKVYTSKLIHIHKNIDTELHTESDTSEDSLWQKKELLSQLLTSYEEETQKFSEFLQRANCPEGQREKAAQLTILSTIKSKVKTAIKHIKQVLKQMKARQEELVTRQHSESSRPAGSVRSDTSSAVLLKHRAKAEATKTQLQYASREAELKRMKANMTLKQTNLETDMQLLSIEREAAVANAELQAVYEELDLSGSQLEESPAQPLSAAIDRTHQYVVEQQIRQQQRSETGTLLEHTSPKVYDRQVAMDNPCIGRDTQPLLDAHAPSFVPVNNQCTDFTKFFLKKELMLTRLTNFDDQPENYLAWKCTFRSVMDDLNMTPYEELDLLVKYLGKESTISAINLRTANISDPSRGLEMIWERLEARYGSPELVEFALKAKLSSFPRINQSQMSKLYDLLDILGEIESVMANPTYTQLLSYFNTSSGVNPIVAKLPPVLQSKWTNRALKYKRNNGVVYPPFTEFCSFMKDMCMVHNDPAFCYQVESQFSFHQNKGSKQFTVNSRKTEVGNKVCPLHNAEHSLNDCRGFLRKSMTERKKIIRDHGICYKCCDSTSHIARDCDAAPICSHCGSTSHPTALHIDESTSFSQSLQQHGGETSAGPLFQHGGEAPPDVSSKCTTICGKGAVNRSCAKTVLVNVYLPNNRGKAVKAYAILDDQSNRTLARSELFDHLDAPTTEAYQYTLRSCAGSVAKTGRKMSGLVIESADGQVRMNLPPVLECNEIPDCREEIPTPEITSHFQHLSDVDLQPVDNRAPILLLIGRDLIEAHMVLEQRTGPRNSPFAQKLALGWVVIGNVCLGNTHPSDNVVTNKTCILGNGRPTLFEPCPYNLVVREKLEHCPVTGPPVGNNVFLRTKDDEKLGPSVEDNEFLEVMDKEFAKSPSGHWSGPLPFRAHRPRLPNNKQMALKRAQSLQRSLTRNPRKRDHFLLFMKDMFDRGHAELAPLLEDGKECWYLPMFGVYHHKKKDQIRVVFDSSASFEGISLNSVLMCGPDLTNNLVGILLRFRKEPVAVMADVERMFYGFFVSEPDRDFLRFLWYKDNDPQQNLVEYRMCVHVFGNRPSPAVAAYGLRKCVQNLSGNDGEDVKEYVERNFYVDDGLGSFQSVPHAISVLKGAQKALSSEGNLRLHKIASNESEVMQAFPVEDLVKDLKNVDLSHEKLPLQHSLGLCWNLNLDCFTYQISSEEQPFTRRGVLSTVNRLFDPLGFAAPLIIQGRILMRDLVAETTDWDSPLSDSDRQLWENWKMTLIPLEDAVIPRRYVPVAPRVCVNKRLHIFSDASEKAIAAVAYMAVSDISGKVHVGFVCGKSKVAPKHGHTMPRLELCAAVLAVELGDMLSEHLDILQVDIHYYTDSMVVLGYIQNQVRRFYIYVSNRVEKIRRLSVPEQWQYVSTTENPADQGTRQLPLEKIQDSLWLKGPQFLSDTQQPSDASKEAFTLVNPEEDKEIRPAVEVLKSTIKNSAVLGTQRFQKFSQWNSLIKAVSLLQHVVRNFHAGDDCKSWRECRQYGNSTCIQRAQQLIIKETQVEHFGEEIRLLKAGKPINGNSTVRSLSPYLDEDGILRVGGRLNRVDFPIEEKNPVLVPGRHHIATLIIRHLHELVKHQGRHLTEGATRAAGFWITSGKRLISNILYKCVKCRKMRGTTAYQKMADLPADRMSSCPPFTFVGVDVFGHWNISTRRTRGGSACSKRWAVLFTCLSSRAVHIELIEEMSSSSFINALRRFQALRGTVKEFRSDCGTNFVGAVHELNIDAINVTDTAITTHLMNSGAVWRFNPPHASHMGGAWERMIGVTRRILDSMLLDIKGAKLTHEVLVTFMAEVCAIINARPLVPVSTDPESPSILSPNVLLTQKVGNTVDQIPDLSLKDMYRSQWKFVQLLAETFWARWRREYLSNLQVRSKWMIDNVDYKIGDLVLLKDKEAIRNEWPVGLVQEPIPSEDGHVRKLRIRVMKDGKPHEYIRPITETVYLMAGCV